MTIKQTASLAANPLPKLPTKAERKEETESNAAKKPAPADIPVVSKGLEDKTMGFGVTKADARIDLKA